MRRRIADFAWGLIKSALPVGYGVLVSWALRENGAPEWAGWLGFLVAFSVFEVWFKVDALADDVRSLRNDLCEQGIHNEEARHAPAATRSSMPRCTARSGDTLTP